MRQRIFIVVVACALGASRYARADEGGFLSAGIGPSVSPMTWDGVGAVDGMPLHLSTTRPALALVGRLVPTLDVSPTTSIGLGFGAVVTAGGGHMGQTRYFLGGELEGTVRAAFRIRRELTVHVGTGPAIGALTGGRTSVGANEMGTLLGVVADASIAWRRFAIELRSGYLRGERTTYIPLMLIVAWHWGAP